MKNIECIIALVCYRGCQGPGAQICLAHAAGSVMPVRGSELSLSCLFSVEFSPVHMNMLLAWVEGNQTLLRKLKRILQLTETLFSLRNYSFTGYWKMHFQFLHGADKETRVLFVFLMQCHGHSLGSEQGINLVNLFAFFLEKKIIYWYMDFLKNICLKQVCFQYQSLEQLMISIRRYMPLWCRGLVRKTSTSFSNSPNVFFNSFS